MRNNKINLTVVLQLVKILNCKISLLFLVTRFIESLVFRQSLKISSVKCVVIINFDI